MTIPPTTLRAEWDAAARLITENLAILGDRLLASDEHSAPALRGWAPFLLALSDVELAELEVHGHDADWPGGAPASLRALTLRAREICAMSTFPAPTGPKKLARRHASERKHAQVEAFARLIVPLATDAERVIDVGSGHGHLTRAVAEQLALPVLGLERDRRLAERARALSAPAVSPSFAVSDVLRDELLLGAGDCVIGLHACGELGDAMVERVAETGAALALVGCCLQKRRAPQRRALCRPIEHGDALDLPRDMLGLSNLTARDCGVEATRAENLAGRERRLALHRLLSASNAELRVGAEIEGLNRRAAQRDLASLVARAFALRGARAPTSEAIVEAASWAAVHHAKARRLSLPRAMLARVLEVFVLLDRALYLHDRGFDVTVGVLFPASVSGRNLALVARRAPSVGPGHGVGRGA